MYTVMSDEQQKRGKNIVKKKIIPVIIVLILIITAATQIHIADITSLIVRTAGNVDLRARGIDLEYSYVARGLRSKPFILPFSHSIRKFSRNRINIEVINSYTVGSFDKDDHAELSGISNFYDPTSKFKDTWFGVFIVMDDARGRGKAFILKDPLGDPADIANINPESLIALPRLDQSVVVHTTHQREQGYQFYMFLKDFPFTQAPGSVPVVQTIEDSRQRNWLKVTSSFNTVSGLTDIEKTDMNFTSSIRAFVGLPDEKVYEQVGPWHPITLKGSLLARYFKCKKQNFWAVVYYNGVSFTTKQGKTIDTWANTDIQKEFEKMFNHLNIGCFNE